jgi:hypothetical protein
VSHLHLTRKKPAPLHLAAGSDALGVSKQDDLQQDGRIVSQAAGVFIAVLGVEHRQVLSLLAGATAEGGFKGIGGRFARNGLLSFARNNGQNDGAVRFERLDTGA